MTSRHIAILFLLLVVFVLVPFAGIQAQGVFPGDTGVPGIVPCGDGTFVCNACQLLNLGQDLINFAVYLSVIVATLAFVVAGFMYVTAAGNPTKVGKAHSIFKSVLIGLIIVLVAWLVVDLIMTTFLKKEFGPWNEILCPSGDPAPRGTPADSFSFPPNSNGSNAESGLEVVQAPSPTSPTPFVAEGDEFNHAQSEGLLSAAGIGISSSDNCSNRSIATCTSLDGIKQTTVTGAIFLKNRCGSTRGSSCPMTITGGTEVGHADGQFSHANGYKIDVSSSNVEVSRFMLDQLGGRGNGTFVLANKNTGESYEYRVLDEGDHLDVTVIQLSPPETGPFGGDDDFTGF